MNYGFRSFHPFVLFTYYFAAIISIMINRHPFFLFSTVLLLILFNWTVDKGKTLKIWFRFLLLFSILLFFIHPLLNHRGQRVLFYVFHEPITLESVFQGAINGLTFLAIMLLFITFSRVLDAEKFLFLFGKAFPKWGMLAMLAVRFVPLFRLRMQDILAVQRARGITVTSGTVRERMKNGFLLVHMLLTWSLEDGIQTADSMAARGYGLEERSRYNPYRFLSADCIATGVLTGLLLLSIYGSWLGDGVLTLSPVIEPVFLDGREWVFFIVHCSLIGFPLIVDIKEEALWLYWKRKT